MKTTFDFLTDPLEWRHPGLRVHPIERDLDPGHRWVAPLIAGPVLALLGAGALLVQLGPRPDQAGVPRAVAVSLAPEPVWDRQPPARSRQSPADPDRLPGAGHRSGTDGVDPSLLRLDLAERSPTTAVMIAPPDRVPLDLPIAPQTATLRKDLPAQPGGNGLLKGKGLDLGRGHQSSHDLLRLAAQWSWPMDPLTGLPRGLRILRQVNATSQDKVLPPEGVTVLLLVSETGRPLAATAIAGDKSQYDACEQAAKQWLFWVEPQLQAQAPFPVRIRFLPVAPKPVWKGVF